MIALDDDFRYPFLPPGWPAYQRPLYGGTLGSASNGWVQIHPEETLGTAETFYAPVEYRQDVTPPRTLFAPSEPGSPDREWYFAADRTDVGGSTLLIAPGIEGAVTSDVSFEFAYQMRNPAPMNVRASQLQVAAHFCGASQEPFDRSGVAASAGITSIIITATPNPSGPHTVFVRVNSGTTSVTRDLTSALALYPEFSDDAVCSLRVEVRGSTVLYWLGAQLVAQDPVGAPIPRAPFLVTFRESGPRADLPNLGANDPFPFSIYCTSVHSLGVEFTEVDSGTLLLDYFSGPNFTSGPVAGRAPLISQAGGWQGVGAGSDDALRLYEPFIYWPYKFVGVGGASVGSRPDFNSLGGAKIFIPEGMPEGTLDIALSGMDRIANATMINGGVNRDGPPVQTYQAGVRVVMFVDDGVRLNGMVVVDIGRLVEVDTGIDGSGWDYLDSVTGTYSVELLVDVTDTSTGTRYLGNSSYPPESGSDLAGRVRRRVVTAVEVSAAGVRLILSQFGLSPPDWYLPTDYFTGLDQLPSLPPVRAIAILGYGEGFVESVSLRGVLSEAAAPITFWTGFVNSNEVAQTS